MRADLEACFPEETTLTSRFGAQPTLPLNSDHGNPSLTLELGRNMVLRKGTAES